jgi:peptidyl-prolyl cis-trans isomerase D
MMKAMRKLTKHILWIVIVAFVGTIIFAWGMEFSAKKQSKRGILASVNGQDVELFTFQYYYDQALRQAEQEQGDLDEQMAVQIRDQVWEKMVTEILLNQEAQKRGIEVTDTELYEYMRRYPPQELQTHPAFQTEDGQFDYQKYLQALTDPRMPWGQVENMVRPNLQLAKLQQSILALVRVTDEEVRQFYRNENEKAKVNYLLVPTYKFQKREIQISDAEIQSYYQEHKQEYKTDPSANLSYVFFEKKADQEDEEETKQRLLEIKEEIEQGEDFSEVAIDYSEDNASAQKGGDLGWFGKGMMVVPFEEVAFSLEPGEISEPVKTKFGWHLIKVEDKRGKDDKQEVKASHILLKISPSDETLDRLKERAEIFADLVRKSDFSELASEHDLSVAETGWFVEGTMIPGIGNMPSIHEFAFDNSPGTKSDLFETGRGFYVFEIKERKPAGISPMEEVTSVIKQNLAKIKADSLAYDKAEELYKMIRDGKSLKSVAEESDEAVFAELDEFNRTSSIPGIGNPPEFIGTAFSMTEPNQISPPVKTDRGTFIIQLISRTTVDDSLFVAVKDSVTSVLVQKKQSQLYQDWFAQVKEEAKIEDYRSEYYREY